MIVWQDMVSGGEYIGNILAGVLPNIGIGVKDNKYNWFSRGEKEWRDDYRRELFEMIDNLYNCTCIGCWVPFNEAGVSSTRRRSAMPSRHTILENR